MSTFTAEASISLRSKLPCFSGTKGMRTGSTRKKVKNTLNSKGKPNTENWRLPTETMDLAEKINTVPYSFY